jgi:arabinan endo-1,5-alpha-L-arabinosidase
LDSLELTQAVAAVIYQNGDNENNVTGNLTLDAIGANGCTIVWSSSDTSVITNTGVVTPAASNKTITLTAAIAKQGYEIYRQFVITVLGR